MRVMMVMKYVITNVTNCFLTHNFVKFHHKETKIMIII